MGRSREIESNSHMVPPKKRRRKAQTITKGSKGKNSRGSMPSTLDTSSSTSGKNYRQSDALNLSGKIIKNSHIYNLTLTPIYI